MCIYNFCAPNCTHAHVRTCTISHRKHIRTSIRMHAPIPIEQEFISIYYLTHTFFLIPFLSMQLWHVETPRCIYVSLTSHIARRYGIMLLVVCTLLLCFLFFFKTKNTSFIGRYTLYLFFSHTFLHARVFAPLSPHEKDNTHFTPPPSKWFVMFLYFSTSHLFLHTQYIHIYLSVAYFSYPFGIGVIIVQEAGGHVTDFSRKPLDFSCGRTLAHNIGMQAYPVSNIILT